MFKERFLELREDKKSNLCVGLDPPFETREEILEFCLKMIEDVCEEAIAIKPNTQFIFPLSDSDMKKITEKAKTNGLLAILDHKLSDIGNTNMSAMRWISRCGFDAFTFSPFAGNFATIGDAKKSRLDVFTLALMSNPEAHTFMKARIEGKDGFKFICEKVVENDGCGCVVGATCQRRDIIEARMILAGRIILVPGIGTQGGSLKNLSLFGKDSLFNVSRDIIASRKPKKKAEEYRKAILKHIEG